MNYANMDLVGMAKVDAWVTDELAQKAINELLEAGKIRPRYEGLNLRGVFKGSVESACCERCGSLMIMPSVFSEYMVCDYQRNEGERCVHDDVWFCPLKRKRKNGRP